MRKRSQPQRPQRRLFATQRKAGKLNRLLHDRIKSLSSLAGDLATQLEELSSYEYPVSLPLGGGIDFYRAVRDFEIFLIKRALRRANGLQVKAADLLTLDPTTLNKKIKAYKISQKPRRPLELDK
jgi:transcriptional regulator with GAF, ATPase, and Fis domain